MYNYETSAISNRKTILGEHKKGKSLFILGEEEEEPLFSPTFQDIEDVDPSLLNDLDGLFQSMKDNSDEGDRLGSAGTKQQGSYFPSPNLLEEKQSPLFFPCLPEGEEELVSAEEILDQLTEEDPLGLAGSLPVLPEEEGEDEDAEDNYQEKSTSSSGLSGATRMRPGSSYSYHQTTSSKVNLQQLPLPLPYPALQGASSSGLQKPKPVSKTKQTKQTKQTYPQVKKNVDFRLKDSCEGRNWQVSWTTPQYKDLDVSIRVRNRTERPTTCIPDLMYSSIQYQFLIDVLIPRASSTSSLFSFLLAKICLLDADTETKLTQDLSGGAPVRGTIEGAISKNSSDDCEEENEENFENSKKNVRANGILKVKFGDLTFFKARRHYMMSIDFFHPENLEQPVIRLKSPAVRIYARKPNKRRHGNNSNNNSRKKKVSKKRRRATGGNKNNNIKFGSDEDPNPRPKKRRKMKVFEAKLSDLVSAHEGLKGGEKKKALQMIMEKMFEGDATLFGNNLV